MSTYRNLITLCAAAVLTLGLAACGGGGNGPGMPDLTLDGVQMGATVEAGTHTISDDLAAAFEGVDPADAAMYLGTDFATDAMVTVAGLDFTCSAGPCSVTINDDGTVTTTGTIMVAEATTPPEPAAPTVADLFTTAQTSSDNAAAAGTAASDAVKAAMEAAGKLGLINAAGESMTEMMNAQAIIDARDAVAQAVMDAESALEAANEAKTTAMGLDDSAQKTALIAALDAAIEAAEEALEDAEEARDGDDLNDAVAMVTGGPKADPQGTPTSLAKAVAMAVGEALGGMTVDRGIPVSGSGNGLALGSTTDNISTDAADIPAMTVKGVTRMSNSAGMTWAEIAGEADVKTMPLGSFGADGTFTAGNGAVKVASVAGMTVAKVFGTETTVPTADATTTNGTAFTSSTAGDAAAINYMGMPGAVFCLGTDCKVGATGTADAGKLLGSWYFASSLPMHRYVKNPDEDAREATPYTREAMYVRYGYWLTFGDRDQADDTDASNDAAVLNRYTVLSGGATNTTGLTFNKEAGKPDSATFNGEAGGMSVHKMLDEDGDVTSIYSGAFTADVELELRFGTGTDITLGGTIDGFEGNAVDSKWTVELERKAVEAAGTLADSNVGKTVASGRDGNWSAQAYGVSGSRPSGVFGTFNAHFSDGHAAGVYAAD